jgi:hypothetical protein
VTGLAPETITEYSVRDAARAFEDMTVLAAHCRAMWTAHEVSSSSRRSRTIHYDSVMQRLEDDGAHRFPASYGQRPIKIGGRNEAPESVDLPDVWPGPPERSGESNRIGGRGRTRASASHPCSSRRFYEREGWTLSGDVHLESPFGLPVVEYTRNLDARD